MDAAWEGVMLLEGTLLSVMVEVELTLDDCVTVPLNDTELLRDIVVLMVMLRDLDADGIEVSDSDDVPLHVALHVRD